MRFPSQQPVSENTLFFPLRENKHSGETDAHGRRNGFLNKLLYPAADIKRRAPIVCIFRSRCGCGGRTSTYTECSRRRSALQFPARLHAPSREEGADAAHGRTSSASLLTLPPARVPRALPQLP
ncbi:hypothetical protein EVAR_47457_1 [Eumeta japonica]|uniref:Uncharacterized protein n=1 Tax=Eumeta variegata TaxID=151549 RepID=A0A4C1XEH5_EUMVA|nr:hypothetical protein EVAR_47457_1 [Eumeta japonica]